MRAEEIHGDSARDQRTRILVGLGRDGEALELATGDGEDAGLRALPLAIARARSGETKEPLRIARAAVEHGVPGAEKALGDILLAARETGEALLWYERGSRGTERLAALRAVAETLAAQGDDAEACAAWRVFLEALPFACPEHLRRLAECHRRRGDESQARAVEALAQRVAAAPGDVAPPPAAGGHGPAGGAR